MAYFGMAFVFLQMSRAHALYLNFGYFVHILMPIITAIALYGPKVSRNTEEKKKE